MSAGFKPVMVKFDDLMYWLGRCDSQGHLERCSDLVEPWAKFEYKDLAMKDGVNVHGAISSLIGSEEMAHQAIAKSTGAQE